VPTFQRGWFKLFIVVACWPFDTSLHFARPLLYRSEILILLVCDKNMWMFKRSHVFRAWNGRRPKLFFLSVGQPVARQARKSPIRFFPRGSRAGRLLEVVGARFSFPFRPVPHRVATQLGAAIRKWDVPILLRAKTSTYRAEDSAANNGPSKSTMTRDTNLSHLPFVRDEGRPINRNH